MALNPSNNQQPAQHPPCNTSVITMWPVKTKNVTTSSRWS